MKQVSYEAATLSFLEIRNGNDDIELVKTVLDYMYQHKPPTQDEITDIWKKLGYEVSFSSSITVLRKSQNKTVESDSVTRGNIFTLITTMLLKRNFVQLN